MISEREFRSSGHKDVLRDLLTNATLAMALEIVGETAKPRGHVEPQAYVPFDTLVAKKHNTLTGIQAALDHLKRLTQPMPAESQEEDELEKQPYFHALPQPMKDAIRKQILDSKPPE